MYESVEWVKESLNPISIRSEIEIRPVFEYEDFGDAITPEQIEREEQMREEIGGQ